MSYSIRKHSEAMQYQTNSEQDVHSRISDTELWQLNSIKCALDRANSPSARFISHEAVAEWLNSWGTDHELEPPK